MHVPMPETHMTGVPPGSRRLTGGIAAGACPDCGWMIAFAAAVAERARCPRCGAAVRLTFTLASYNGEQPCDDRCQYAQGEICSCSCGGVNHRRGYIAAHLVPAYIRERDAARLDAKKQAAARRAQAARDAAAAAREALIAEYPLLGELLTERFADVSGFADDMRLALRRGEMTPRQITAACRLVEQVRERDAERARQDAEKAAARAAGVRVPSGRVTFTGEIVKADRRTEVHGYRERLAVKVMVRSPEGWAVWGTLPRAAWPTRWNAVEFQAWVAGLRGQTLTLTAEVKPAGDDPLFGYFSRPHLVAPPARVPAPAAVPVPARTQAPAQVPAPAPMPAGDAWAELLAMIT